MTILDLINDLNWTEIQSIMFCFDYEQEVKTWQLKQVFSATYLGLQFKITIKHQCEYHPDNQVDFMFDEKGELNYYFSEYINSYKTTPVSSLIQELTPHNRVAAKLKFAIEVMNYGS